MKEGFVFLDHAQVIAGAFFDGFQASAQIQHLGVQRVIALLFFLDVLVQCLQAFAIFADLLDAGITKPQPVLEVDDQGNDEDEDGFNGAISLKAGSCLRHDPAPYSRILTQHFERAASSVTGFRAQLVFDFHQTVVFSDTVRAAQRTGFDLAGAGGDH